MKHPRRYRPFLRRFAALTLAGALCSAHAGGPGETNPGTAMARVRALIGAAGCESDAQCRSIGIGTKACGGPEFYLAWSIAGTDEAALLREV
ncbi:MAG: hypothetical protein H7Y61_00350, partial [Rhizobiales bacterium]|nr:hypothetical protein [Rhizobacter sp.]